MSFFVVVIGTIWIQGSMAADKQAQTCLEYRNEMMYKMRTQPDLVPTDMELPECDVRGNYKLIQCFGKWSGYGNCGCYKKISGERIERIRGVSARSPEVEQMTCLCAYDQVQTNVKLDCNVETGDYNPVRCAGSRCFCAERNGAPMHGPYRSFNKGSSNCLCARDEHDYRNQRGRSYDRQFSCSTDGGYNPIQRHGRLVYCVNQYGMKVGTAYPSDTKEGQNLRCP